mgnify:CR=1 FL=1
MNTVKIFIIVVLIKCTFSTRMDTYYQRGQIHENIFLGSTYQEISLEGQQFCALVNVGANQSGFMGISLYSSDTFVTSGVSNFTKFECDIQNNCSIDEYNITTASYPYFSLEGSNIVWNNTFFSAYHNDVLWGSGQVSMIYASNFTGVFNGEGYYGIIGLGINSNIFKSLVEVTQFALKLDTSSSIGTIALGNIDTSTYSFAFSLSNNISSRWEIPLSYFVVGKQVSTPEAFIIFDMMFNYIGIPSNYFKQILSWLETEGVTCTKNIDFTYTCTYNSRETNLPAISFYSNGQNRITLLNTVYLQQVGTTSKYNLLLVPTTSTLDDTSGVFVNEAYKKCFIFGNKFLSNYLTIFDFSKPLEPKISFYKAKNADFLIILMLIIPITFGTLCMGIWFWRRFRRPVAFSKNTHFQKNYYKPPGLIETHKLKEFETNLSVITEESSLQASTLIDEQIHHFNRS